MRAEDSDLWNDPQEAQKMMRERQGLEDNIKGIEGLQRALDDNVGLIELGEEEGDDQVVEEARVILGELYRDRPWLRTPEAFALRAPR